MRWTQDQISWLTNNYYNLGGKLCAKYLACTLQQVHSKTRRLKLKRAHSIININSFYKIDNKCVAYILGLLWADGYVHHNNIGLEMLADDIDEVRSMFKITGEWKESERTRPNRRKQKTLRICNKELSKFLIENGYVAKSNGSADDILNKIPSELKSYWLKGYWDGDGCFYINDKNSTYQATACSSHDQDWTFLKSILNDIGVKYSIRRVVSNNSYSILRITNKADFIKMAKYAYNIDNIGMSRKFHKIKHLL